MKTRLQSFKSFFSIFALCLLFGAQIGNANPNLPTGMVPVSGNISASQIGNTLNVTSTSNNSISNWNSFDIGQGFSTIFSLPNANSVFLNRVTGTTNSQIWGTLQSNGRILLINHNGVLMGPNAKINVNSFMASTLNISNANFLSGNYIFNRIGNPASVVNQGTIIAQNGGTINLFGSAVSNTGTILAPGGQVNLAVGEQISFVNPTGIGFQVTVDRRDLV
jgi:filamentous hemagglutinin family protein